MTQLKTDIDSLFKQVLAKGKVPVTDKSMSAFKKGLAHKSFFSFSIHNFNIHYIIAGVALVGMGGLLYRLNDSPKEPIKPLIPTVKVIKATVPQTQTLDEVVETKVSNTACATPKKQNEHVVTCTEQKEVKVSSETKAQTVVEKEVPVIASKPQVAADKIEIKATSNQKQLAQKIDTLYANDTIKTVKRKVRVKWSK